MNSSGLITRCVVRSRHGVLSFNSNLPGGVQLHPFVGKRRPAAGAAQLLKPLAVMRLDSHRGVQAEAVDFSAQRLSSRTLARHRASQGQHLLAGARTERMRYVTALRHNTIHLIEELALARALVPQVQAQIDLVWYATR